MAAVWMVLSPLYLFATGVYETNLREGLLIIALGAIASIYSLSGLYDTLAIQNRAKSLAK